MVTQRPVQRVQQAGGRVGLELGRGQADVVLGQQRPDPAY
jgi:hypothetical protein